MRIIAGSAGGTRLVAVPAGTRPLSDRAREGVFSSLGPAVGGATVLDLWAGTGALGIEALSRGAERAVFVDHAEGAVRTIGANLERSGLAGAGSVLRLDVHRFLRRRPRERFDLAFADPPHATDPEALRAALALLPDHLARDATIVLTRPRRSDIDVIPVDLRVAKTLGYGDTLVHLVREDPRARERGVPGDL